VRAGVRGRTCAPGRQPVCCVHGGLQGGRVVEPRRKYPGCRAPSTHEKSSLFAKHSRHSRLVPCRTVPCHVVTCWPCQTTWPPAPSNHPVCSHAMPHHVRPHSPPPTGHDGGSGLVLGQAQLAQAAAGAGAQEADVVGHLHQGHSNLQQRGTTEGGGRSGEPRVRGRRPPSSGTRQSAEDKVG